MFSASYDGELFGWLRDEPVDAPQQAWLEKAVGLGIEFSREVSGDHADSRLIDVIVIGRAAETLWAASPGSPHWRDLDVDVFLSALERARMGRWRDSAIVTLIAFAHFLAKHGYVSGREALVLRSRLDPHAPPAFIAAGVLLSAWLRPN